MESEWEREREEWKGGAGKTWRGGGGQERIKRVEGGYDIRVRGREGRGRLKG